MIRPLATESISTELGARIAVAMSDVMTGFQRMSEATQRATNAAHALNAYIERAQTVQAVAFVRRSIDHPNFRDAAPGTRARWIRRLEARIDAMISEAVGTDEICFVLNATFTDHLFPASEETRERWGRLARARIAQLETTMNQNRTDTERATFVVKLKEAEVIISARALKFVDAIQPLARQIARGEGGEFTPQQRESIDMLIAQNAGKV